MKAGDYIICRAHGAGVFAGTLAHRKGQEVILTNARRLWYWDGAASLSQLCLEGVSKPGNCKFPAEVPEVILLQVIEMLPVSEIAKASITGVPVWKK